MVTLNVFSWSKMMLFVTFLIVFLINYPFGMSFIKEYTLCLRSIVNLTSNDMTSIPTIDRRGEAVPVYERFSVTKLCFFTVSLPLFAFITCVLMTMYKDFQNANKTHCDVPNVFPSISASIGNYEPQSSIWKLAIYAHAPMRFFIIYLRWEYYRNVISDNLEIVIKLTVFLNVIENLALIGLSHWTSSLHYSYHEFCFKTFIGTSVFYMLFSCMMLSKYRRKSTVSSSEMYSIKLKWRTFLVNIGSFAFAAYFFLRHNRLCEPYVYSLFGFSEYIVVISNIMFHLTTVYDLRRQFLCISLRGIHLE